MAGTRVRGQLTSTSGPEGGSTADDSTRERILIEASFLFADQGYHRTSTREIAQVVDLRQPSLFHHFPSKASIMEALLALNFDRAVKFATAMVREPGSAGARLSRVFRADLEYLTSLPYDLSGTMRGEVLRDPTFRHWERQHKRLHRAWLGLVEQGIKTGQFVGFDRWLIEHSIEGIFGELIRAAAHQSSRQRTPRSTDMVQFIIRFLLVDPLTLPDIAAEADALEARSTLKY